MLPAKTQASVISEINQSLRSEKINLHQRRLACYALTRLFPKEEFEGTERRQIIYDVSAKLFEIEIPPKLIIDSWAPEIWSISDRMQAELIVEKIATFKNLNNLSASLQEDSGTTIKWLANLASLFVNMQWKDLLECGSPILPNQNGTFCELDKLFSEAEAVDEILKDIAASLIRDFRDELIDNAFNMPIPGNRKRSQKDVANEINSLISDKLRDVPRPSETQIIFRELILWMSDNPDTAEAIFGDLYKNRHRLYDDIEVARNLRRVDELEEENEALRLEREALKSEIEELKSTLSANTLGSAEGNEIPSEQKQEIDDDFLIAYGECSDFCVSP